MTEMNLVVDLTMVPKHILELLMYVYFRDYGMELKRDLYEQIFPCGTKAEYSDKKLIERVRDYLAGKS